MQRALERQSLSRRATLLERGLTPPDMGSAFVGESPGFRRVAELIERVAPSDSAVLITGETGSGKEIVAKLIHARSAQARPPVRRRRVRGAPGDACSRASCSATNGAPSPAPTAPSPGCSRWRTAGRSSWTRSARSARPRR